MFAIKNSITASIINVCLIYGVSSGAVACSSLQVEEVYSNRITGEQPLIMKDKTPKFCVYLNPITREGWKKPR